MSASGLHLVFSSAAQECKVFAPDGTLLLTLPMHDAAVNGPGFARWGRCVRGSYSLGAPIDIDEPSMGMHFTPVLDVPGRSGVGVHGGGTGLSDPFAPRQGWVETHGCLRVQNIDNAHLVVLLRQHSENRITVGD